jgi:hypothetical protein
LFRRSKAATYCFALADRGKTAEVLELLLDTIRNAPAKHLPELRDMLSFFCGLPGSNGKMAHSV